MIPPDSLRRATFRGNLRAKSFQFSVFPPSLPSSLRYAEASRYGATSKFSARQTSEDEDDDEQEDDWTQVGFGAIGCEVLADGHRERFQISEFKSQMAYTCVALKSRYIRYIVDNQ